MLRLLCPLFALAVLNSCIGDAPEIPVEQLDAIDDSLISCTAQTVEGLDVSDGQGFIDWGQVANTSVRFAISKATQGTYNTQSTFARNWQQMRAHGIIRGAYHFFDPTQDGAAQARHFLATVGPLGNDDLPLMLDLECPDGNSACLGWAGASGQASAANIRQRMLDFLSTVENATGRVPFIYTFPAYLSSNRVLTTGLERYPLWIAGPSSGTCFTVPAPWSRAYIWQYDWFGRVPGISSNVDRNRFLGSLAELQAFARAQAPSTRFEQQPSAWTSGVQNAGWSGTGDFDGDGRDDLVFWRNGTLEVARSTGSGFTRQTWAAGIGGAEWAGVGDFDGDGRDDLAWYEGWNDASVTILRSTGSGFASAGKWLSGYGAADWAGVGDFDGDGKSDLAWYEQWNDGRVTVLRSTGSSLVSTGAWLNGFGRPDWASVGDFDGDGRSDLAWYEWWNQGRLTVARSNGQRFDSLGAWLTGFGQPDVALTTDVDGDGRDDLVWYEQWNNGAVTVARSTGTGLMPLGRWLSGWGKPNAAFAGDFDGDRRGDLGWLELWNGGKVTTALARP